MSIEKSVLEKLLKLPVDKQKEVLAFVEPLEKRPVNASHAAASEVFGPIWASTSRPKTLPRRAAKCGAVFPARMFEWRL
jgi:hypothetical protein